MSFGNSFGAFAQGLKASHDDKKDRQERKAISAQNDKLIDLLGAQIANGGGGGGFGASSRGYGLEAPGKGNGPRGGAASSIGADPASFQTGTKGTGKGRSLLELMDHYEGGGSYDTLFGHSQRDGRFKGTQVSDMTIGEALDFSDPKGEYGQWVASENDGVVATPMGRHQIVGTTLRNSVDQMGLPLDAKFDQNTQDAIFRHLATNRIKNASTPEAARTGMRNEWVGFRKVPDNELDAAISQFRTQYMGGGMGASRPVS